MATSTDHDDRLVALANDGDTAALATLLERHLHPAWRIALAASPSPEAAEAAVVTGFCDALNAAGRSPDVTVSVRTRIAAAVHRACVAADRQTRSSSKAAAHDDPAIASFAALPVASRTALWLTEVEGGTAEQVAPILGLDRNATEALADRAAAALRDRLATEAATRAVDPACRIALGKLPAQAAGKLTSEERGRVGEHLAGCGSCASWLAAIVAPRPALRRLVVPVPGTLPTAVAEAWADRGGRDRSPLLRAWSERAVGAAAAAVLAVGLAGAVVFGGRSDDDEDGPELASPAGAVDLSGTGDDEPDPEPTRVSLPAPVVPSSGVLSSGFGTGPGTGAGGSGGGSSTPAAERPRTADPTTPTTAAPPTTTTPTTTGATPPAESPSTTAPPTTQPPAAEDPATIDLGIVSVDLDETPQVEVEIPGLPPVSLLP